MSIEKSVDIQEKPIKGVEKLKDGSVKLSYSKETSMGMLNYTFNIKKSKENGKYYIINQTPDTPENKGYLHHQKEKYEISLASFDDFFKSLGKALDSYIGKPRPSLSEEKGERAFLLLGGKKGLVINDRLRREEEKNCIARTKKSIDDLKNKIGLKH